MKQINGAKFPPGWNGSGHDHAIAHVAIESARVEGDILHAHFGREAGRVGDSGLFLALTGGEDEQETKEDERFSGGDHG